MCRRTTCKQCGKPNWAGCGAHVEQVLGDVPKSQRCSCRETGRPTIKTGGKPTVKAGAKAGATPVEPSGSMARFKAWLQQ